MNQPLLILSLGVFFHDLFREFGWIIIVKSHSILSKYDFTSNICVSRHNQLDNSDFSVPDWRRECSHSYDDTTYTGTMNKTCDNRPCRVKLHGSQFTKQFENYFSREK